MISRTVSSMLCRSPSVRVIGSIDNFDAFTFLCDPAHSIGCGCFNYIDTVCGSAPPSSSSASYPVAVCAASHTACTASFLLFSVNCAMHNLASSFFLCVTDLSISVMSGACHSSSHVSRMLKMTSFVATKGSFLHCLVGSLHTLIVMKPAQEKIEKIDQCLRIQPLRGGNLLYIT